MSRFTALTVALASIALAAGTGPAFGQLGDGSTGTVQVTPPPLDIHVDPTPGGTGVTASATTPAADSQTATASTGTVQAVVPSVSAGASASPSQDGTTVDPNASFSTGTGPATGGPQTADDSTGTAQIGGAGSQTATGSLGTVQVAQPGTYADGSIQGPLRPDMPDGAVTPEADASAGVDPAASGPQAADGSTGTVQVGGGTQAARNSTGTAQIAVPSVDSSAGAGGSTDSMPDGSVSVTPSGGPQTTDGSTGTLQIGGGSPTATDSTGTAQVGVPALGGTVGGGGGDTGDTPTGTFFSTESSGAAPAAPAAMVAGTQDLPTKGQSLDDDHGVLPLGASMEQPLAATAALAELPFTGLALWLVSLVAIALAVAGYVLRRGTRSAA